MQACRPAFCAAKSVPPPAAAIAALRRRRSDPDDLRRIRSCQDPGAAHGVADRVPPTRRSPEHQCYATVRRALDSVLPGRFTQGQYKTLLRHVNRWREGAWARGVVVGPKTYRRLSDKPCGRRPDIFNEHWAEMVNCLEDRTDQTALRASGRIPGALPGRYGLRQLHTLQRRVRAWRREAVQRLVHHMDGVATDVSGSASGNILHEAIDSEIM